MEKEDQKLLEVAICGYLPYGMKCNLMGMCKDDDSEMPKPLIYTITGINKSEQEIMIEGESEYYYQDVFPLLYPIECLTKPITVEGYNGGKEFVPIEELAKVHVDWSALDFDLKVVVGSNLTRQFNLKISWKYGDDPNPHFNDNLFIFIKKPNDNKNWVIDLLNQWHIDWRGLIAKGLAVDKTTI